MTINTLQQLSQPTSTKISINIYSYKTCDVYKQKSYKCYSTPLSVNVNKDVLANEHDVQIG